MNRKCVNCSDRKKKLPLQHFGCRISSSTYGFSTEKGMDYGILERYGFFINFPANQLGKIKKVWVMEKYGLSELWVIGVSTVLGGMGYRK
jgi:hypothetical protein